MIGIHRGEPGGLTPAAKLADLLIDSRDPDMGSKLRAHTAGRGADVIFNTAGGPILAWRFTLLAHRGRQVEITSPSDRRVTFRPGGLLPQRIATLRPGHTQARSDRVGRHFGNAAAGFRFCVYQPPIVSRIMPLAQAQHAYELVAKGRARTRGSKATLTPVEQAYWALDMQGSTDSWPHLLPKPPVASPPADDNDRGIDSVARRLLSQMCFVVSSSNLGALRGGGKRSKA